MFHRSAEINLLREELEKGAASNLSQLPRYVFCNHSCILVNLKNIAPNLFYGVMVFHKSFHLNVIPQFLKLKNSNKDHLDLSVSNYN